MSTDNQSAQSALLPCPFCGGEGHSLIEHDADWPDKCFMSFQCRGCRAESGRVFGTRDPSEWADARALWNTRATPPTPEQAGPSGEALTDGPPEGGLTPGEWHDYLQQRRDFAEPASEDNEAFDYWTTKAMFRSWCEAKKYDPECGELFDAFSGGMETAAFALASPGAMEGAQAAQPVAWRIKCPDGHYVYGDESPLIADGDEHRVECLYAHPPTGEPT